MKEKWPSFNRNVVNREAYTVDKPANGVGGGLNYGRFVRVKEE